jgi:hypothetical protein
MNKNSKVSYRERQIYYTNKITNFLRKYYIYAYNIYGWYWLYKIFADSGLRCDWESYLLWVFAMLAQLFFEVDVRNTDKNVDMRNYFDHYSSKTNK